MRQGSQRLVHPGVHGYTVRRRWTPHAAHTPGMAVRGRIEVGGAHAQQLCPPPMHEIMIVTPVTIMYTLKLLHGRTRTVIRLEIPRIWTEALTKCNGISRLCWCCVLTW